MRTAKKSKKKSAKKGASSSKKQLSVAPVAKTLHTQTQPATSKMTLTVPRPVSFIMPVNIVEPVKAAETNTSGTAHYDVIKTERTTPKLPIPVRLSFSPPVSALDTCVPDMNELPETPVSLPHILSFASLSSRLVQDDELTGNEDEESDELEDTLRLPRVTVPPSSIASKNTSQASVATNIVESRPIVIPARLSFASMSATTPFVEIAEDDTGVDAGIGTRGRAEIDAVPLGSGVAVPDDAAIADREDEKGVEEERDEGSEEAIGTQCIEQRRERPRHTRKLVQRRMAFETKETRRRRNVYRLMSLLLVTVILLGVLVPLGAGIYAYGLYSSIRATALDGVNHLMEVKTLLAVSKSDPLAALDTKKLQEAKHNFVLANSDFLQLQQLASRPDVYAALQQFSPDYASKLLEARHLINVALDVSQMGQELCNIGQLASGIVHSSPLATGSSSPLISVDDITAIDGAVVHTLYYLDDIQAQMQQVHLSDIPISASQKAQLQSVLTQLPSIRDTLTQSQGLVGIVSWLLGVGQPRHFLIQTLDSAELRPSGGFTGQYGVITVDNGRMGAFNLRDVALLDYAGNGVELGRQAPPQYSSWMNFGNWGLRDSNLSGDYPTTARMSMQVFQDEGGGPVDGDISFTPAFIGHILDVTGPIHVAEYNETITSKNLEDRLHYYQQDYNAIAIEHQKTNDNSHSARKAFTSLLGKLLLDKVRHLSTKQLLTVIKNAVKDLQSRDLEIYFTNPQAEQWLIDHGYSGSTDSFNKQDGFTVVQANISISKASQYVHTTEQDNVVLDSKGGATHNLTITLDYKQTGPVYGFDTYADYIRVYVPQSAQFLSGDGFDTGQALCKPAGSTTTPTNPIVSSGTTPVGSGPVQGCDEYKTYFPSDARYCPSGNYDLGDRNYQVPWVIDSLGAPTNLTSDLPGHQMWGGLTETPKNCISYITLSWYVPHAVKVSGGNASYALLVQKQSGYIPTIDITVDDSTFKNKGMKPFTFKGNIQADKLLTIT